MTSKRDYKTINSKEEKLTIEKYRELSGDYDSTDADAEKAIDSISTLTRLIFDTATEELRRKKLLEQSPKGYHFDKTGYSCTICGSSASGEDSWYDKYGLKCMNCQKAINEKIIPGSVATKKESWYSKFELESYFNIKGKDLNKYIKQGFLKDRIIPATDRKPRLQIFLISDNKDVLPPKELLKSRTVKVMRNDEEYYTSETWYEFADEKRTKKLCKYRIVECFKESFAKPIETGRLYYKDINPLFRPRVHND